MLGPRAETQLECPIYILDSAHRPEPGGAGRVTLTVGGPSGYREQITGFADADVAFDDFVIELPSLTEGLGGSDSLAIRLQLFQTAPGAGLATSMLIGLAE